MRSVRLICGCAFVAAAACLAAVWWAHPIAVFFGRRTGAWDAADFSTLYSASRLVASGHGHELLNTDALAAIQRLHAPGTGSEQLAYLNPPFFALLLAPLSYLTFGRAYQAWTAINLILLAATCYLVWRATASLSRWQRLCLIAGLVTAYPVTFGLRLGQFSMLLLVSWTAAYACLRTGADRTAGIALAGLLIKPELLIPISVILIWKKRYAVFATLAPLTLAAIAASFAVVGGAEGLRYPLYLLHNAGSLVHGTRPQIMFGWNGLLGASFRVFPPLITTLLAAPLTGASLAAAAWVWRGRLQSDGPTFPSQWLLLTLATVLADPNFFLQDIVIVFPALFTVIASSYGRLRSIAATATGLAWVFCGLGLDPSARWHVNLVAIYMAAGVIVLVWQSGKGRGAEAVAVGVRGDRAAADPDEAATAA